jgi:hypothetical protein
MIRLIFRTNTENGCSFHTLELNDKKAEILLCESSVIVGVEDCRQAPEKHLPGLGEWLMKQCLDKRREMSAVVRPLNPEVGPDGGFIVPSDLQTAIEKQFREDLESVIPDPVVAVGQQGIEPPVFDMQELWMLRDDKKKTWVKTTDLEGGESYIACPSLEEARKVAQQQQVYDIQATPVRVV